MKRQLYIMKIKLDASVKIFFGVQFKVSQMSCWNSVKNVFYGKDKLGKIPKPISAETFNLAIKWVCDHEQIWIITNMINTVYRLLRAKNA